MTRPLQNGCPFSSTYIIYHFAGAGKMVRPFRARVQNGLFLELRRIALWMI